MTATTDTLLTPAHVRRPGATAATVLGLGVDLPTTVVTNDDLAVRLDTSDEWIRSRTGIGQRHVADPGDSTSDLAVRAARAALADAQIDIDDITHILVATSTPDHMVAATAPAVAAALGSQAPALDLNAACSGFVHGLRVAVGLVASGDGPVLLIGADCYTRIVDPDDRGVAILFGDGAGAIVLGAGGTGQVGPFDLGSDGRDPSILWTEAGGARTPSTLGTVADGRHHLSMRGREVYRLAVPAMADSSSRVLAAAGLTTDDVSLVVAHQANARILTSVANRLGIELDRLQLSVEDHANTSAASIPLALADARDAGRLHPGDLVLLTAFGAGLTWGSCLIDWTLS